MTTKLERMHYVLVWWFNEKIRPLLKGYADIVVYADDFVCCFQYKNDAELFYEHLKRRMNHFGLSLEESKTQINLFWSDSLLITLKDRGTNQKHLTS
ncbi:MAG: hypothetical protein ACLRW4_02550 [Ruminococcus sp.]